MVPLYSVIVHVSTYRTSLQLLQMDPFSFLDNMDEDKPPFLPCKDFIYIETTLLILIQIN